MTHRIKIDTTIKGGLPVTAQANVYSCPPWEYPGRDNLEELEIFFLSGCPYNGVVTKADEDKVCDEIFAAYRSELSERGYRG